MKNIRNMLEQYFETLTCSIYDNRFKALFVMLSILAALVSQIPKITIDTSMEGFLHKKDPIIVKYNEFRDQFGRDEIIILAIKPKEIFDLSFLKKIKALHEELEKNVPYLDDITSMINARNTQGMEGALLVDDLMADWPENDADLAKLKETMLSNPIYKNMLISEDAKLTTIIVKTLAYSIDEEDTDVMANFENLGDLDPDKIGPNTGSEESAQKFLTDEENSEVVNRVREIAAKYNSKDFSIYVAGSPVVTHDIRRSMLKDMPAFMKMAVITIAFFLFLLFRRISGVIFPLIIVIASLLSTIGLMSIFNVAIKLPTQILPSFLLAVGIGDSVHILAIFFKKLEKTNDRKESIIYAMGHSGLALTLTSLTTAAGLLSFATAKVAPIADLGLFAGAGVMIALVYTVILMPALIAIVPIKARKTQKESTESGELNEKEKLTGMDKFLTATAHFSVNNAKSISIAGIAILIIMLISTSLLRFSHNPLAWLPENMDIRKATTLIDKELKGSGTVEVIIDTGKENGLYNPDILNRLDKLGHELETYRNDTVFVGKTITLSDFLKEIHKALNENRKEYYVIPQNRNLIAQEFLLFANSGSDDLEDVVDSQFSKARFTVRVPWMDAIVYSEFIHYIENLFKENFKDKAEITVTGMISILARTLSAAIISAAKSYAIAFIVITIMMILLIGEIRLGLISMIPNITPIIITLGIMHWFNIPLDMFTMLIGSIAIGLVVDDTVHFMHNFRRYFEESGSVLDATIETLQTTGRAMLVTTIVLSIGFFIFMFASMSNLFYFGLLTGITIILALAADFLLAPALITLMIRGKQKRNQK